MSARLRTLFHHAALVLTLALPAVAQAGPVTVQSGQTMLFNVDMTGLTPAPPFSQMTLDFNVDQAGSGADAVAAVTFFGELDAGGFSSGLNIVPVLDFDTFAFTLGGTLLNDGLYSFTVSASGGALSFDPRVQGLILTPRGPVFTEFLELSGTLVDDGASGSVLEPSTLALVLLAALPLLATRRKPRLAPALAATIALCGLPAAHAGYVGVDLGDLGGHSTLAFAINNAGQVAGSVETANGEFHAFVFKNGSLTDLGSLGGSPSFGVAINDTGRVAGQSFLSNGQLHAAIFGSNGSDNRDLGTLGGNASSATAINSSGQVTGTAGLATGFQHAFRFSGGTMFDLGTLGGSSSDGKGINAAGQVVGSSRLAQGGSHGFVANPGAAMIDIGTLGGTFSGAIAINTSGQVAGSADLASGNHHAVTFIDGVLADLGTLGGTLSSAEDINDAGQVVGLANRADGTTVAFLYSDGVMNDLGTLGGTFSQALDINALGQVIGNSSVAGDTASDFFIFADGVMTDIDDLVDDLFGAGAHVLSASLNDLGQIAGQAQVGQDIRSFVLTPDTDTAAVPEPGSLALSALALLAGSAAWRQRRQPSRSIASNSH